MNLEFPDGGNVWLKILLDPGERPPRHFHSCPECYRHFLCYDPRCTLEPDLELDDGSPSGSHCLCATCNPMPELDWTYFKAQKAEAAPGTWNRLVTPSTLGGRATQYVADVTVQGKLFGV
jgi:hypothetical protein